ncbi:hypothetical protein MM213_19620 [Belliella sp. R4-6]|uniref:Uncharacterized protein n=1 Tax=Belliella alkalica TaxID=1730871 RepID=A0ABS9VHR5_9BACT|nr:hypothetical protein [Belliella alkalica]
MDSRHAEKLNLKAMGGGCRTQIKAKSPKYIQKLKQPLPEIHQANPSPFGCQSKATSFLIPIGGTDRFFLLSGLNDRDRYQGLFSSGLNIRHSGFIHESAIFQLVYKNEFLVLLGNLGFHYQVLLLYL